MFLFILFCTFFQLSCSFQGVEYPGITLQCHQVHQWQAYSLETAEKEILHLDLYLDHVGEGVQGPEGHVGVPRVQVRLVQRQSQLLKHTLLPNE